MISINDDGTERVPKVANVIGIENHVYRRNKYDDIDDAQSIEFHISNPGQISNRLLQFALEVQTQTLQLQTELVVFIILADHLQLNN